MKITIDTIISAETAKVWDCYTNPKHIINWNFASDDWCCPHAENDLRIGGKYNARMEAKDGSLGFDFIATYNQIVDEENLTYTLGDNREVSVQFIKQAGNTKVIIIFDAENVNSIDIQKSGWQSILNNFKLYVESN